MITKAKLVIGAAAMKLGGVKRIHIIGCARSGTTFLQYCMLAYRNVMVVNAETSPNFPDLRAKLALARLGIREGGLNYVTKRTYGWYWKNNLDELVASVRRHQMGVILVIRDPRAVLESVHPLDDDNSTPYVEEERWHKSILAGEEVWARLRNYPRKCILTYEDIVSRPDSVDQTISETFSLERHADVEQINQVKTNAERVGYRVSESQRQAMHSLRDADPADLDKPLGDAKIISAEIREKYAEVIATYYANAGG